MEASEGGKGRICVTGATGFIASWTVKCLLEHGYSVNATTRTAAAGDGGETKRDLTYLTSLPGAAERLRIFHADLHDPQSFVPAIEGCIGVFHMAHPLDIPSEDSEIHHFTAAVKGILNACADSKTVKRVVFTSSVSAFAFPFPPAANSSIFDESCWSDLDTVRRLKVSLGPYVVTKTITEKLALELAAELGLDLVSVGPSWVTGPFLCPYLPFSVQASLALIYGIEEAYMCLKDISLVHVEDVARAHIHLFEHPEAKGQRYLCAAVDASIEELHELISRKYPQYKLPNPESWEGLLSVKTAGASTRKLLETGFKYNYGLEEMLDAAVECAKAKGFL